MATGASSSVTAPDGVPAAPREAGLVFVGGFPSGGTDLVMTVLNAHPDVFLPGEFPLLPALASSYGASVPAPDVDRLVADLRRFDGFHNFVNHHWSNFTTDRRDPVTLGPLPPPIGGRYRVSTVYQHLLGVPEGIRWTGNKTPGNTENIARLRVNFPDARFVVVARDVRDVALSWQRKWAKDPVLAAAKWDRRMRLGLDQLAALPAGRGLLLSFEGLLDDLDGTARSLCHFLGLPFDPAMLRFHERVTKTIRGKPLWGQPLQPGNYGKWRTELGTARVRRIEEVARPAMGRLGYRPAYAVRDRPIRRWEVVRGRVRDALASVTVMNRYHRGGRWTARRRALLFDMRKQLVGARYLRRPHR